MSGKGVISRQKKIVDSQLWLTQRVHGAARSRSRGRGGVPRHPGRPSPVLNLGNVGRIHNNEWKFPHSSIPYWAPVSRKGVFTIRSEATLVPCIWRTACKVLPSSSYGSSGVKLIPGMDASHVAASLVSCFTTGCCPLESLEVWTPSIATCSYSVPWVQRNRSGVKPGWNTSWAMEFAFCSPGQRSQRDKLWYIKWPVKSHGLSYFHPFSHFRDCSTEPFVQLLQGKIMENPQEVEPPLQVLPKTLRRCAGSWCWGPTATSQQLGPSIRRDMLTLQENPPISWKVNHHNN